RAPGGTLVYKGAAAASFAAKSGLSFALQALEDFRYDTLDAKVALAADGVLALGVRLQGVNPAVEQGRAIQFNLNVTESLPALLQSLRAADRITEQVERRLVQ
ncbi:MAG TPA: YdbH domain-containing protein, partial [Pseudomonadales bacterium]|nr:YdbH domain-containing protein [Pseudomonadales bacterium]